MEPEPSSKEDNPGKNTGWAATYLGIVVLSLGVALSNNAQDIKEVAGNALAMAESRLGKERAMPQHSYECSSDTRRVRVRPGDSQWSIEQRLIDGVDIVPRGELSTRTIEQNPGNGILQPGDTVIVPKRCWRESTPQS